MKIRKGFVSNSSSSSFVLEFESRASMVTVAGNDFSMQEFLDSLNTFNLDTGVYYTTRYDEAGEESDEGTKQLLHTIDSKLKWAEDEKEKAELTNLREDIKKGEHEFAYVSINYHDRALMFLFNLLRDYELFKVRFTAEG